MASCSSCGGNRLINRSSTNVNRNNLNTIQNKFSFKDKDFTLGYVLVDINPLIGSVTKINYGKRNVGDKIFIHVNDIDEKIFGKEYNNVKDNIEIITPIEEKKKSKRKVNDS